MDANAGATVTITGNSVSENKGTASVDGSKSAAFIAGTFFGAGTDVTVTDNTITDNTCGVTIGFNASDATTAIINNNDIFDNTLFGVNSTNALIDASNNWWGDASGPSGAGIGTGDTISQNVIFCPWLTTPKNDVGVGMNFLITNLTKTTFHCTIQDAVDNADPNDVIEVKDGTYNENVTIDKAITLQSVNGAANTIIQGSDNGVLGTLFLPNGVDDVTIGGTGTGFTIIGFDNDNGAVEAAAVYLQGAHQNITIQDNEIVADGEAGLLSEFNAMIDNIIIDSNTFSGQTFAGTMPDGVGFSTQFNNPNNVPRQLVVMGGGDGVTNSMNVTFTNNKINGVAGGISSDDGTSEQGNTLVTIDVLGATITDNNFMGTTTRFGSSLRVRGDQTIVKDNTFSSANLGVNNSHIFFGNPPTLGFANASDTDVDDLEGVMLNNTFDVAAGVFNSVTPNYVGAIVAGPTDQEVLLLPDTYPFDAQVVIDENRTIRGLGTDKSQTILTIDFNTINDNDDRGWFLVNEGFEFGMENLTVDGSGGLVWQAVRHRGFGTFENVRFTEIKFNESGPNYAGTAITAFGTTTGQANVTVNNSMFDEIGRIGVQFFGAALDNSFFTNNMYTGKGIGDFIDYAVDANAGATVTITGNSVSENKGTASVDGSKSAAFIAGTLFGAGTDVTVTDNTITDNTCGVTIGFNASDATTAIINNNDIFDNTLFGVNSTNATVDATGNWWGDPSGPSGEGPGTGDTVSVNVVFCPWLTAPKDDPMVSTDGFVTNITKSTVHCTIQEAVDKANSRDTIEISAKTYEERVTIDKSLTLQGATSDKELYVLDGTNLAVGGSGIAILPNVTNVTITNLTVQNYTSNNTASQAGIAALGSNDTLVVQNVKLDSNLGGRAGLYANGPIDSVLFDQVMAINHNSPGFQRGIVIWNNQKSNITISNCMASNNACCGIELQDGTASGVNIINNTLTNNADNGIGLTTLNGLTGANLVSGNVVTDCGRFGIEIKNPEGTGLDTGVGSIVVENNTVSFTASTAMNIRDHVGIGVFRRALLNGNPDNYPDVPTGVIVRNNMVSGYKQLNASATTSEGFGIVIEGTNHIVMGNTIEDNDIGLQLQGGGHPNPNYVMNDAGDGDQSDGASPNYFGRGNSPVVCDVTVGTNTFANNTTDKRLVDANGILTDMMDIVAAAKKTVTRSGDATITYCSIQAAIDDASAGETISPSAGLHVEDVVIDKAITLEGPNAGISPCDGTRVEGAEKRGYINITVNGVTIDGMDFVDGKQIPSGEKTAIQIVGGVENTTVQNSSFIRNDGTPDTNFDTFRGIINEIGGTTNLAIDENSFSGWHTGIYLQNADATTVTNNCIDNNMVGISSDNPIDVDINNNDITNNQFEGIGVGDLGGATSIKINNNNITGNLTGVSNYSTNGFEVDGQSNWWGDAAGPNENNTGMPGNGDIVNETPGEIDFCPWLDDVVGTGVLVPEPMAVTRDLVIALDANGNAAITASQVDGGSTNGCDEPPTLLEIDVTTFNCDDVGNNTITLTITDEFGRMDSETATVTIVDNAAPLEIKCPDDITVSNDVGLCSAAVDFEVPAAYDIAYFESFESGFVPNTYSSWIEFSSEIMTVASGTNGITSTEGSQHAILNSSGITPSPSPGVTGAFTRMNGYTTVFGEGYRVSLDVYMDLDDPAVAANTYGWDLSSAIMRQDGNFLRDFIFHTASNAAGHILVGGSNNSGFTRRNDLASINNFEITTTGWYTFEWIFRDDAGVLAVDLNLRDNTGALLFTETRSTPADDIATTVGGNRYTWFTFLEVEELAIDNHTLGRNLAVTCSANGNTVNSGDVFDVGTTTVTCMATDACGNEVDCSFDITVNDTEKPVANCKSTFSVTLGADDMAMLVPSDLDNGSTDNCTEAANLTFSADQTTFSCVDVANSPVDVTLTITDEANNSSTCIVPVMVIDATDPEIECILDEIKLSADANCEAQLTDITGFATATDNCDMDVTITQDPLPGTIGVGTTTVTLTATDDSNNTATCTIDVIVEDDIAPTITNCPTELSLTLDPDDCTATTLDYTSIITVDDNCTDMTMLTITQVPAVGEPLPPGDTLITITVTDEAGNPAICSFNLNVMDVEDPVAVCTDFTAMLGADGTVTIMGIDVDGGSTDNCGIVSFDVTPNTFDCDDAGTMVEVTLTVTDASGNMDDCKAMVTIVDDEDPVFASCAPNVSVDFDANCEAILADYTGDAMATDNCDATITQSPMPGTMLMEGDNIITLTATDPTGNFVECQFTVTLNPDPTCTSPDLTVTTFIDQLTFDAGVSRDFLVSFEEINGNATDGTPARFFVPSLSTFDITFDGAATSAAVLGGTPVDNGDWMATAISGGTLFTYAANGGVLPASSASFIGLTITRNNTTPDGATANISVTIFGGDGGEDRQDNNQAIITVAATASN
ncbi:MAG: right-handed parallel beta-helix repeat-containing protein [Bacteroidota bacterium]